MFVTFHWGSLSFNTGRKKHGVGGMQHFVSHTSHFYRRGQCGKNGPHFGGSVAKMGCHTLAEYTISQCKATVSSLNEGGGKQFSVTNSSPEKKS